MNPKIEKLNKEITRTRQQITQAQARLREQEQKRTELENTEIIAAFRATDIPLGDLAAYIRQFQGSPVVAQPEVSEATAPATPSYTSAFYTTQEETEIEE